MRTDLYTNSPVRKGTCVVKSAYEPGMKLSYDETTKRVVVAFRGRIAVLPDTYENEERAIAAGELHCRRLGWNPEVREKPARKIISLF